MTAAAAPATTSPKAASARRHTVPQLWFVVAVSYASAVTLLMLYVIYLMMAGSGHQLESLPDVKPAMSRSGKIQPQVYAQDAPMPPGHTLRMGESRQFGHLIVTPLRVTREPLEFVYFQDDPTNRQKPPASTAPVLKLWVRLENAASSQAFIPLGQELVFGRHIVRKEERANSFVCRAADKSVNGKVVLPYPHVLSDVWDLKGQDINRELSPGESFETFIPSDVAGIDELSGDLLWRLHIRKGHNPKSGRGVTTLIEVAFPSSEIASRS